MDVFMQCKTWWPCVQDWEPGSRCRAVYSEDGLVYPAVVLWVKGQRCRVRFDNYNNEEDQDLSGLLKPNELHGPSTADTKVKTWTRTWVLTDHVYLLSDVTAPVLPIRDVDSLQS